MPSTNTFSEHPYRPTNFFETSCFDPFRYFHALGNRKIYVYLFKFLLEDYLLSPEDLRAIICPGCFISYFQ